MRPLRKFIALPPAGRSIVLRCLLFLPMVTALLRLRGMARTTAWLEPRRRRPRHDRTAIAPREIARLVGAAASTLGATCLSKSMVLRHLLQEQGVASEIRLGLSRTEDGKLIAHAWIEAGGVPLDESADVIERYEALPAFSNGYRADPA